MKYSEILYKCCKVDMICVYKFVELLKTNCNIYDLANRLASFFLGHPVYTVAMGNLREHSLKLFKPRFKSDCGKFMFANRVITEWDLLTENIVACDTIE